MMPYFGDDEIDVEGQIVRPLIINFHGRGLNKCHRILVIDRIFIDISDKVFTYEGRTDTILLLIVIKK